mmetsp:Transcript_28758/g.89454  ORF Transcript_28758/g.89454 Transcript_28758/m.89454 type:complete len:162 (+) Transcript_28758:39-524(+)|eukprot:CAMPEP_0204576918 /NCGR_PEP_ID=MMETSP0661-20131031/42055_1 /ASSEMBLY_ACC=CAM_ASM_000606 /TAXON_ID=109239 /ORGANISM="Alexandrium margalefi, Strain AMGDE01CS-322" /LENGTH=161 /DNA_ID=CAMNT_0051585717 /DNA_START=39 /DNA_END=524 /DNA_ORIENTATION=-
MAPLARGLLTSLALAALAGSSQVEDSSALIHKTITVKPARAEPDTELELEESDVKVGDILWHNKVRSKVVWDGRPAHDFVKIKLLEGMNLGKTKIVEAEELTSLDPAVERKTEKVHKEEAKAKAHARKHAPPTRDSVRRRRAEDLKAHKQRKQKLFEEQKL